MTAPRCPICEAAQYACGPPFQGQPAGKVYEFPEEDPMSLQEYEVVIHGVPTTALLTPKHAERLGATPITRTGREPEEPGKAAKGKARQAANKAG